MAAKKARKTKKAPSAKQLAARRKFALAAKARSKAAKAKAVKRPARKAATKRNGKTVIKAKRVTILNLKKNPAFEILKEATPATKGSQSGWKLGKSFYAKGRGQAKLPGGALLDLGSGFVYRRVANPKKSLIGKIFKFAGDKTHFKVVKEYKAAGFIPSVTGHTLDGKKQVNARIADVVWMKEVRKKNIAGFMQDGVFHPIRSGVEQRTTKSGVRRVKSKKAYKPSRVGEKRTYSAKKAAKRGVQSKRMTAATKQRKATTTRLASRLLDRSGPKKTRRNPPTRAQLFKRYKAAVRAFHDAERVMTSFAYGTGATVTQFKAASKRQQAANDLAMKLDKQIYELTGTRAIYTPELRDYVPTPKAGYHPKRNPNADTKAAYESFQGKPSTKSTSLNFPNGTPANVYKLGTLHSITLQSGAVVKPAGKTVWLCADTKGKLHLGTSGERLVNAPKGALGKVKEVEYITTKPHLGDNKPTRYYHELGEETGQKPTLYSDGAGGLVFKGGATYVRSDGIHN